MTLRRPLLALAAFAATFGAIAADFAFRDGDRVVFLGDSITEQRLYTTYVEAYVLTRHPDWSLTFRNVGWGGDTAWLRQRAHPDEGRLFAAEGEALDGIVTNAVARGLGRDVLPHRPTVVTVKFGMNDHSYQKFRPDIFRAYARSQAEISRQLQAAGARVTFLTPQPIEERRADPDKDDRNLSLRQFSDGLKDVAAKTGAGFVDQFQPFMDLMLTARAKDPKAFIGGGDAVHPGPSGQLLMAWAVLKGLGATAPVSAVSVDAAGSKSSAEGCTVSNLKVSADGVSFDRLDAALPFPVDDRAVPALGLAPVLADLSRYTLTVTGLPEGDYEVGVDGETTLKTNSKALAEGVDLTRDAGAVTRQAQDVLKGVFRKNDVYFERWRGVQLYNFPGWAKGPEAETRRAAELQRLDTEVANLEKRLDESRKPRSHTFTVRKAK
jgi:lysophospholipase L1-like esterase